MGQILPSPQSTFAQFGLVPLSLPSTLSILRSMTPGPQPEPSPTLDSDGLLRHRGRWVAIPDLQIPIVELLLTNLGRCVRTQELVETYEHAGGTTTTTSFRSLINRLARRVEHVDLTLHVIRARGLMLDLNPLPD